MMATGVVLLSCTIFLSVQLVSLALDSNQSCPVWLYYSNTTHQCQCGFHKKWIQCNQQEMTVRIRSGFCVTYSGKGGLYYGGTCPLSYKLNNTNRLFSDLCVSPDMLESAMCGPYNRRGFQCGQCMEGYGPGAYTVSKKCAECKNGSVVSAILLYLLAQFFPIIIFFILVMVFQLNCLSGPMLGYVLFCQGVAFSIEYDGVILDYYYFHTSASLKIPFQLFLIIAEFWRLAPLKAVIAPLCITDKISQVQIILLHTLSPFYAFFLVILSFILIHIHSKNYRIINFTLKPFKTALKRAHIPAITGASAIRAFSTFLFLSSTSSMFALSALMKGTYIYSNIDHSVYRKVLFIDPSVEYFSSTHILYFLLVLVECICLVFTPSLIVFIYPTNAYKRLSRFISNRKQLAITAFVEALNSSFKDGLNGTRDYRSFAGVLIFWVPLLGFLIKTIAAVLQYQFDTILVGCFLFLLLSLYISYIQPCKFVIANASLSFYIGLFGVMEMVVFIWYYDLSTSSDLVLLMFIFIGFISQAPFLLWGFYIVSCYAVRKLHCMRYQRILMNSF